MFLPSAIAAAVSRKFRRKACYGVAAVLLLAFVVSLALVALPAANAQNAKGTLLPEPEDVNQDGVVNAIDLQITLNAFHEGAGAGPTDVNGDNRVDAIDIQRVLNVAYDRS